MDALAALRLQVEWGADEALEEAPQDRLSAPAPVAPAAPRVARMPAAAQAAIAIAHPATAAADLPALARAVAEFTSCSLRETAAGTLWTEGDGSSGVLVIGDPPSAEDDRAGHVFQSADGVLSMQMLAAIGLERATLLACPLIPWRPPGDRPPSVQELAMCLPFVQRLIVLARPRALVLAGALATKSLMGTASDKRRLRPAWTAITPAEGGAKLPTLMLGGIAALRTGAAVKQAAWAGLRQLRRHLDAV